MGRPRIKDQELCKKLAGSDFIGTICPPKNVKKNIVPCCIYLTTYDWIKSFLKITIDTEPYMEI